MKMIETFRIEQKMVAILAWSRFLADKTLWTMTWSEHQYQMEFIVMPVRMPSQGKSSSEFWRKILKAVGEGFSHFWR